MGRLVIIISFLVLSLLSFSQESKNNYLESNCHRIPFDSTGFIDNSDIQKYSIYLTGEVHNKENNRELELTLLKKLYYQNHVRYFVVEFSEYFVSYINQYLIEGKEEELKGIIYNFPNKEQERNFYIGLRKFWNDLPQDQKFKMIGVDVNPFNFDAMTELCNFLPQNEYDDNNGVLNNLFFLHKRRKKTLKVLQGIKNEIELDSAKYKSILTNNYPQFMHLLKGSLIGLKNYEKIDAIGMEEREEYMYENIKSIIKKDSSAKIFGQFGRAHVPINYQKTGCI